MSEKKVSEYDYTMMSTFLTCRRKYKFRHVEGLVPMVTATPLAFGGAIHTALDEWYKSKDTDKAVEIFKGTYEENIEVDNKRTHRMGEWILRNYNDKYLNQPCKTVATEQAFTLPLPNGNNLIGRLDKIVDWDGVLWVMDHKTTSQLGYTFFNMHTPNLQFDGYVWAARQLGYNVQGLIVDAMLVAKGLLESSSRARLTPLARDFAIRSDAAVLEYVKEITNIQGDMDLTQVGKAEYYPNYDACTYYGECAYRRICMEDPSIRDKVKKMDYKESRWDPRG